MLLWASLCAPFAHSKETPDEELKGRLETLSIPFIANEGQLHQDVSFYARTFAGTVFVKKTGNLEYSFATKDGHTVLTEEVRGASSLAPKGEKPAVTRISSFTGKDPAKWKSNLATYESISLGEISKGITLSLRAKGRNVEKIFTVSPGIKPEISMRLSGAKHLNLTDSGELEVITERGTAAFTKPIAYQEIEGRKVSVPVAYALAPCVEGQAGSGTTYDFAVGSYDTRHPLVIDPLLASTFVGGSSADKAGSITLDTKGNVYVAGSTTSETYPTTEGVYDRTNRWTDVFVSKFDPGLSTLLASTFVGGSDQDSAAALVLDQLGNVYIVGTTYSADYPTTEGAYRRTFTGDTPTADIFVSKLDSSLSALLASTFVGGSADEVATGLILDTQANVYFTGYTFSADYPTTPGAYEQVSSGGEMCHVIISKLDRNLGTLIASTYVKGSSYELAMAIGIDGQENLFITGITGSADYPTTAGSYNPIKQAAVEFFVSKIDSGLTTLLASTFINGSWNTDSVRALTLDTQGNVYIAGATYSSGGYPTTEGAYSRTLVGQFSDGFISKFDPRLSTLIASTFLGGYGTDEARALFVDNEGNVHVTGVTASFNFPTTRGAYSRKTSASVAFLSQLDSNLSSLQASTYIGGSTNSGPATALVLDAQKNVYITGYTNASDYPTTEGAYDRTYHGSSDIFISKLDPGLWAPGPYSVTVARNGHGTGTVVSPLLGIDCGSICSGTAWSSDVVTMTAIPDDDSVFRAWSGACTGNGATCSFSPTGDLSVTATFYPKYHIMAEYYPIAPKTIWDYSVNAAKERVTVLQKTVLVEKVETNVLQYSSDHSQNFYTSDENGIRLHGSFLPQHNVRLTMVPPITLAAGTSQIGQTATSQGEVYCLFGSGLNLHLLYYSTYTIQGFETVTVPAGTFDALKISYSLSIGGDVETGIIHLARSVGEVREAYTISGKSTVYELTVTNSDIHDLAITNITAPALVNFTKKIASKIIPVKVTIQNRGIYPEMITDASMLNNLISLSTTSLGSCPNPAPVLTSVSPNKYPITLKPKSSLTATYNMTFDCVNDRLKSTPKDPHHHDYSFRATVDHSAIDGIADGHSADDTCPRTVAPPYLLDPYPDGTIKDKGCGARKSDGTFGNDILLDIVAPG